MTDELCGTKRLTVEEFTNSNCPVGLIIQESKGPFKNQMIYFNLVEVQDLIKLLGEIIHPMTKNLLKIKLDQALDIINKKAQIVLTFIEKLKNEIKSESCETKKKSSRKFLNKNGINWMNIMMSGMNFSKNIQ